MKKYIEDAKNAKIDWQTLLIQDTETDIKVIIRNAILRGASWAAVNTQIVRRVQKTYNEIEIPELKERAQKSLLAYATVEYRQMQVQTADINLKILPDVVKFRETGKATITLTTALENLDIPTVPIPKAEYRPLAVPLNEWTGDYMKKVNKAFNDLINSTAKDEYSARVSLRNISEMTVRYEAKQREIQSLIDSGEDLVWISTHANCSKRCEPFQGKLYSLSGRSGRIDGIEYRPLSVATDVYYTTKSGKTYKNGCISGYNCRHTLIPYRKGNKPVEVSAEVVARERKINTEQRRMETAIRHQRETALLAADPKLRTAARKKAAEMNKQYKQYCIDNKVPYYPQRLQISDNDLIERKAFDAARAAR